MALSIKCLNGHGYVQADIYEDWTKGAPICPICFKKWAEERGIKVEVRFGEPLTVKEKREVKGE